MCMGNVIDLLNATEMEDGLEECWEYFQDMILHIYG